VGRAGAGKGAQSFRGYSWPRFACKHQIRKEANPQQRPKSPRPRTTAHQNTDNQPTKNRMKRRAPHIQPDPTCKTKPRSPPTASWPSSQSPATHTRRRAGSWTRAAPPWRSPPLSPRCCRRRCAGEALGVFSFAPLSSGPFLPLLVERSYSVGPLGGLISGVDRACGAPPWRSPLLSARVAAGGDVQARPLPSGPFLPLSAFLGG
jgi:hypothetical protein